MDLYKALEILALGHSTGSVSNDVLISACEKYKTDTEAFVEDFSYHMYVTKSLMDSLNDIEPDDEVCKAVIPGQTKVVDGVTYIYTATPNAKTAYDWRVLGNIKSKKQAQTASDKTKELKDFFPSNAGNNLKVIKKLGGSTGADLVEDANGNQFVRKRGSSTSNEHVESEYLAAQLYSVLGVRVPDAELYEENGETILLTRFLPLAKPPTASDYPEMAKKFAVDALLANWDIYQNDNILKDATGKLYRVDLGGSLNFRAQGSKKNFGRKLDDWDSMIRYNPSVLGGLDDNELLKQANEVLNEWSTVVAFLQNIGNDHLANIFDARFKSLVDIKNDIETRINKSNRTVKPRVLKSDADMYRDLSDDELNNIYINSPGDSANSKVKSSNGKNGWDLLSKICEERGFNARPDVVDKTEYWKTVAKSKYQIFRGISNAGRSAEEYADDFRYDDDCYYGTIGVYGAGLYFHVNDADATQKDINSYKKSTAYSAARSYARSSGAIIEAVLDPNAKVGLVPDLINEIRNLSGSGDPKAVKALQDELDAISKELEGYNDDLHNVSKNTEDDVKKKMQWDNDVLIMSEDTIDSINWGKLDDYGNPDYPSFDDFFNNHIREWVTKNGGTVTEKVPNSDVYILKLPHAKESFMFSRFQYENKAIKQKNAFTKAYNYPVKRLHNWLIKEHYQIIDKAVNKAVEDLGSKISVIKTQIHDTKIIYSNKKKELDDLTNPKDSDTNFYSGIKKAVNDRYSEAVGAYAAAKGYDAIVQPHGNGGEHSYMIVLNRSKVIVNK